MFISRGNYTALSAEILPDVVCFNLIKLSTQKGLNIRIPKDDAVKQLEKLIRKIKDTQ